METLKLVHGHSRKAVETPTHISWRSMIHRCEDENHENYPYYGGRGVTICGRWRKSFASFLSDMGERPEGTTIDRIDPGGNYEPGNCRWATEEVQQANRRVRAR
jgi:hypothetical protein